MGLVDLLIRISGKCKFAMKCGIYSPENRTCTKEGGMYYQGRPAGCYRELEKEEQEK